MDDAYLGGERSGKRGRGSENKIPFIAGAAMSLISLAAVQMIRVPEMKKETRGGSP